MSASRAHGRSNLAVTSTSDRCGGARTSLPSIRSSLPIPILVHRSRHRFFFISRLAPKPVAIGDRRTKRNVNEIDSHGGGTTVVVHLSAPAVALIKKVITTPSLNCEYVDLSASLKLSASLFPGYKAAPCLYMRTSRSGSCP